ncbi:PREDICTED: serine carboxypeptidase-like 7 isoform X4 [Camelina sativa]|uniref:Serine carboxypeptidase-like 7 isoform X4 n=1 Tax=Camelina sativa TaxID=90675 RepID=A0ABM0W2E1_CAMSA|nr:PREDICTED: serine carboxypeptidase-like 7 isoform X4 [Camelina sativa]
MAKDYVSSSVLLILFIFFYSQRTDSASIVEFLPGFDGPLPFELETGYIGVGEEEEVQLFYYFIKSERNPKEVPLLLWLSGGPGCSSISGLFYENGPVTVKLEVNNGTIPSLVSTPYSWTKVSSIIYLDQPVGTGFSYSRTQLVNKPSDSGEAKRIHEFLHKWLGKHQEFSSNSFYVGGDSYSGKVVPALVQEISKGNYLCCKPPINLQSMKIICKGDYINVDPRNRECLKLVEEYEKCIARINPLLITTPVCEESQETSPNCYEYRYMLTTYWANYQSVHRALHVNKGSIGEWVRCHWGIPYTHDIKSSIPYHMNNSIDGYPSLIFSGDHDMVVPFLGTQAWIRSLNYSLIDDWRPWMIGDQTAGYTRTYANKMTFATIKGGGHTPEYKPEETSIMFQRWISGQPL